MSRQDILKPNLDLSDFIENIHGGGGSSDASVTSEAIAQVMAARGAKIPKLAYTAPTITLSAANAATGIAGTPTQYNPYVTTAQISLPFSSAVPGVIGISPYFTFSGCSPQQAGGGSPDTPMVKSIHCSSSLDNGMITAEFYADSTQLEIITKGQAGKMRVVVDGVDIIVATSAGSTVGGITLPGNTGSVYNILIDWGIVRGTRHVRIEVSGAYFGGVRVGATESICPAVPEGGTVAFIVGDSLVEGSGADNRSLSFAGVMASELGWTPYIEGSGGTGYLSDGANARMTIIDRVLPPYNSWRYYHGGATGGTFTFAVTRAGSTQTTAAIAYNASVATLISQLEGLSNVGSGNVAVFGGISGVYIVEFRNALADDADCVLVVDDTSITGGSAAARFCTRFLGDVKPYIPTDGDGNELPFFLVYCAGYNDTADGDPSYTSEVLAAACAAVWEGSQVRFPTAIILATGPHSGSSTISAAHQDAEEAMAAQAELSLVKVNGNVPYVSQYGMITGTGQVGTETGSGNADIFISDDGIHSSTAGAAYIGRYLAAKFARILGIRQN